MIQSRPRGYTRIKNDEGSYIFGGRQRAFVVARFTPQWRTCLFFVYCEEINEPNEPLDAWWSVEVVLHFLSVNLSRISNSQA